MTYMHCLRSFFLVGILLQASLFIPMLASCSKAKTGGGCAILVERLQQPGVYDRLIEWVDSTIVREKLPPKCLTIDDGSMGLAGAYRVKIDFDWGLLGLGRKVSSIFITCDRSGAWRMLVLGNARQGVFVSLNETPLPSEKIVYRYRRVAVYCDED